MVFEQPCWQDGSSSDDDDPPLPAGIPGCFTDTGMFAVARQLLCLAFLSIDGASVTDAGLQALSALQCLTYLKLIDCLDVTGGALEAFLAQRQQQGSPPLKLVCY